MTRIVDVPRRATLADGRSVELRPIAADDEARLDDFHHHLSPETQRRRFFTPHPHLTAAELRRFTHVDGDERLATVAVCDDEIVGVGRYESLGGADGDAVEGAWVVRDDFQGQGLGRLLAAEIAEQARRHGKRRLLAETLADNVPMRRVLLSRGLPTTHRFRDGVVEMEIDLVADGRGSESQRHSTAGPPTPEALRSSSGYPPLRVRKGGR